MKNRFTGTMRFHYNDGYVEETRFIEHKDKGNANFIDKIIEAICENIDVNGLQGKKTLVSYEGDFANEILGFMKFLSDIGNRPAEMKEIMEIFKINPKRMDDLKKTFEGIRVT